MNIPSTNPPGAGPLLLLAELNQLNTLAVELLGPLLRDEDLAALAVRYSKRLTDILPWFGRAAVYQPALPDELAGKPETDLDPATALLLSDLRFARDGYHNPEGDALPITGTARVRMPNLPAAFDQPKTWGATGDHFTDHMVNRGNLIYHEDGWAIGVSYAPVVSDEEPEPRDPNQPPFPPLAGTHWFPVVNTWFDADGKHQVVLYWTLFDDGSNVVLWDSRTGGPPPISPPSGPS